MLSKLGFHVRRNVVSYLALFVALGGTAAYAASSDIPDRHGVFHACVNGKTGAVRIVTSASRCHKTRFIRRGGKKVRLPAELAVLWNQQGRPGAKGNPGTAGPGAMSSTATVESGAAPATLAKLDNGISVVGSCPAAFPTVTIKTTSGLGNLELSGTTNGGSSPYAADATAAAGAPSLSVTDQDVADFDGVARDKTFDRFAHIDAHGDVGGTTCHFWALAMPSS
jgi:hypothetical protein